MDWINEKFEKLFSWVRNLTFRRAMIAYILLTSVIVWALSFVTMRLCWQWENSLWKQYDSINGLGNVIVENGLMWMNSMWRQQVDGRLSIGYDPGVVSVLLFPGRNHCGDLPFLPKAASDAACNSGRLRGCHQRK